MPFLAEALITAALAILLGLFATAAVVLLGSRPLARWLARRLVARLTTDPYRKNLWEYVTAMVRTGPQMVVETNLRAARGRVINRPLGSPRPFPRLDGLLFAPAQLARLPTPDGASIDLSVTLGPASARPLHVTIPLLMAPFGYGIGVSERVKIALALAANRAGTAASSGEGPPLPEELEIAERYVLQWGRNSWGKDPGILRRVHMVEIHLGQGAEAGAPIHIPPAELPGRARDLMGLEPGEVAVIHSRLPTGQDEAALRDLIERLRQATGGVPIGVRMIAGDRLEEDMAIACRAGADFVSLDGAQAATKGSPPVLEDDFGLPTLHALCRASRFLDEEGLRGRVSLIASGGLFHPGDFLKAIALGADAVYVGTAVLYALVHGQAWKGLPTRPLTELVLYNGGLADRLDVDRAARSVANFLAASAQEMELGVRSLGKRSLREVGRDDLCALDRETARLARVRWAGDPWPGRADDGALRPLSLREGLARLLPEVAAAESDWRATTERLRLLHRALVTPASVSAGDGAPTGRDPALRPRRAATRTLRPRPRGTPPRRGSPGTGHGDGNPG